MWHLLNVTLRALPTCGKKKEKVMMEEPINSFQVSHSRFVIAAFSIWLSLKADGQIVYYNQSHAPTYQPSTCCCAAHFSLPG